MTWNEDSQSYNPNVLLDDLIAQKYSISRGKQQRKVVGG